MIAFWLGAGSVILIVMGITAMVLEKTGIGKPDSDTITHRQSPDDPHHREGA